MSEDRDNKTHAPTLKKLEDARKRGEVATSPEMRHAVMLLGIWTVGGLLGGSLLLQLAELSAGLWSSAGRVRVEPGHAAQLTAGVMGEAAALLLPLLGALFGFALLIALVQGRPTLAAARLKPKWSRLNPVAGLTRMFGKQGLVEFAKTVAKCVGVLAVCAAVLHPQLAGVEQLVGLDPLAMIKVAGGLVGDMLRSVLLLVGALAAFDFAWQHRSFLQRMRMSLQEVKDEHKQSDGDPAVKARQRQVGAARARSRMMAAVPTASVIVTNPTHYAVALRYDHGAMRAPMVVAKGTDLLALRIREVAGEHKVPVVESPPLARALYASAEVDRPIPIEHYAAVAEIISYVMELARTRR